MKLMMIMNSLESGGRERRSLELLKQLQNYSNIKIHIVFLSKAIFYQDFFDLPYTYSLYERKTKKDPSLLFKIIREVKQFKPDLMHCWSTMPTVYSIPASLITNTPIVNSMISNSPLSFPLKARIFNTLAAKFSKIVLSNSYAGIKAYGTPPSKTFCIHNGFDMSRIKSIDSVPDIRKKMKAEGKKILGMVAIFAERKDHPTLVKAALNLLKTRNDFVIVFIGIGPLEASIKNMIPEDHKDSFVFLGQIANVFAYIKEFYAGLLVSKVEGMPNSIMEYMALKKPVIATDTGGTSELVESGKTGYIVKRSNINELCEKINMLLDRPELAEKFGDAGYLRVKEKFQLTTMTQKFVDIYHKALE